MQKNDRRAIGGAGFGVSDIQDAGIDLLQRAERCVRPWLDGGQPSGACLTWLCGCGTDDAKLSGCRGQRSSANKVTAMPVYVFSGFGRFH